MIGVFDLSLFENVFIFQVQTISIRIPQMISGFCVTLKQTKLTIWIAPIIVEQLTKNATAPFPM